MSWICRTSTSRLHGLPGERTPTQRPFAGERAAGSPSTIGTGWSPTVRATPFIAWGTSPAIGTHRSLSSTVGTGWPGAGLVGRRLLVRWTNRLPSWGASRTLLVGVIIAGGVRSWRTKVIILAIRSSWGAIILLGAVRPFPVRTPGSPFGAVHCLVTFGCFPFPMTFTPVFVPRLQLTFFPSLLLVEFGWPGFLVAAAFWDLCLPIVIILLIWTLWTSWYPVLHWSRLTGNFLFFFFFCLFTF